MWPKEFVIVIEKKKDDRRHMGAFTMVTTELLIPKINYAIYGPQ